jgi:hypothetical protein
MCPTAAPIPYPLYSSPSKILSDTATACLPDVDDILQRALIRALWADEERWRFSANNDKKWSKKNLK